MRPNVFACAQIQSSRQNVRANIEKHLHYACEAAAAGAAFLLFPEMSLTGYERELAVDQYFTPDDSRLEPLQSVSDAQDLILVAGAPLKLDQALYIGSFIIAPKREKQIYIKQYLHPGEESVFSTHRDYFCFTQAGADAVAHAICYDIENDPHIEGARIFNPSVYAASIFYSARGIDSGLARLSSVSRQFGLCVVMANYCGTCWDTLSGGKSSIWNKRGDLVAQASEDREELLFFENS